MSNPTQTIGMAIEMSDNERRTRELFNAAPCVGSADVIVGQVFRAMWQAALPVDRIVQIGEAMSGFTGVEEAVRSALVRLTRAKVLRSRSIQGKRHYEVNY